MADRVKRKPRHQACSYTHLDDSHRCPQHHSSLHSWSRRPSSFDLRVQPRSPLIHLVWHTRASSNRLRSLQHTRIQPYVLLATLAVGSSSLVSLVIHCVMPALIVSFINYTFHLFTHPILYLCSYFAPCFQGRYVAAVGDVRFETLIALPLHAHRIVSPDSYSISMAYVDQHSCSTSASNETILRHHTSTIQRFTVIL